MSTNLISVIIPCYNAQRTVGRCLTSVLRQTYPHIEVIALNDASTDRTLRCLHRYAEADNRLRVVNICKNGGVDLARFRGIAEAKGDYLCFVDADDWLPPTAVEALFSHQQATGADIVEGSITRTLGRHGFVRHLAASPYQVIDQPSLFDDYFISFFGKNVLSVIMCGKLYRSSLFQSPDVKPSGFGMGEDLLLNMRMFPSLRRYVRIPDNVYFYRYGGGTCRYNPHLYPDLKAQYRLKLEAIRRYSYGKALRGTKIEMCNVLRSQLIQMQVYGFPRSEVKAFFDGEVASGFVDEITAGIDYRLPYFPYLKNKDLDGLLAADRRVVRKGRIMKHVKRLLNRFL